MSRNGVKYHKVVRNPTSEDTFVITRRTLNETYAAMLIESGKIFVSDLDRRVAWRTAKRLSEILGVEVEFSMAAHMAEGKEYGGYEFRIAGELKCKNCGAVIIKT